MKYGNKKVSINGIKFDSRKEARRYAELVLLQRAGQISNLQLQVEYELIPSQYNWYYDNKGNKKKGMCLERAVKYRADFVYTENGETVVEDTKGMRTKDYIIKRKLMLYVHNIRIREV